MKRILPFALILGSLGVIYACSSSSGSNNGASGGTTNPDGGPGSDGSTTETDGSTTETDGSTNQDGSVTTKTNPIEGVAAPKQVADALGYADAPQWWQNTLYVSRPLDGFVEKVDLATGMVTEVTALGMGKKFNGASVDKNNNMILAENTTGVWRYAPDGGALTPVASSFFGDGGVVRFDNANDLVQHTPSGVIFVTDPGYASPMAATNHLVRIFTDGGADSADEFPDAPRPNGIALTKDGTTLYVGVSSPVVGTKPYIKKYTVSATGALTNPTKFVELPHPTVDPSTPGATNDEPDGLGVDDNGNVYVAWRLGVNVYKSDGTRYGAADPSIAIASPNQPTNLTFGGTDRKTLFVTTSTGKIFQTVVNIPGVLQ